MQTGVLHNSYGMGGTYVAYALTHILLGDIFQDFGTIQGLATGKGSFQNPWLQKEP